MNKPPFLPHSSIADDAVTADEKPYNACLNCIYIGRRCDGPNFVAMEMRRLSEWCSLRKKFLQRQDGKWTNQYIADQAHISKASVDRIISGDMDDVRWSTISPILKVLVNGTWGQYPCAIAAMNSSGQTSGLNELTEKINAYDAECNRLRTELEKAKADACSQIDFLKAQIKTKDDQISEKNKHLSERAAFMVRKDRAIRWLSISVGICVLIVFVVLATNI